MAGPVASALPDPKPDPKPEPFLFNLLGGFGGWGAPPFPFGFGGPGGILGALLG